MTTESNIIYLNVGGKEYTTTLDTLTKFPGSMLGSMFSGNLPSNRDDKGRYFIDANGEMFKYILDYLRRNVLTLPYEFKDYKSLIAEVEFFQVQPMLDEIKKSTSKKPLFVEGTILLCIRDINHFSDKEWILKAYLKTRGSFEAVSIQHGLDYQKYINVLQEQGYQIKVGPRGFTAEGENPDIDEYLASMHGQGLLNPPHPGIFMGRFFSKFDRYEVWSK